MVQAILDKFEHHIDGINMIPSTGGVFEVIAGDTLVFSKKELGRHATVDEVLLSLDAIIGPVPDPAGP